MLYPFVDGRSGWDAPPAGECLYALGQFLRRLHTVTLPGQYSGGIVHETYADTYRKKVKKFLENLEQGSPDGAAPADFFTVVRQNRETMREMISYLEGITGEIKNASPPLCLCHGDIHAGNLLLTPDDFYVVDWDTAMLAPKEKDVMFFGGGIGNRWNREEETEWFYRGYGKKVETNRTLLKYYRYERIIEDVYEFARLITDRAAAEAEKTTALELFRGQFEPDNAVDMALRT